MERYLWQKPARKGFHILPLEAWLAVRVTLVPKLESTDMRPISITSVFWRLIGSLRVQAMNLWIQAWAPQTVQGGIPERCVDKVNHPHPCASDLYAAVIDSMMGAKIDLSKCFDRVGWALCL